jgi:hypothetical protein
MSPTLLSKARPTIILDTNLLFPASTRDLFVHLAIEGFFELLIPKVALEELGRTLQASGVISEEKRHADRAKIGGGFWFDYSTSLAGSWFLHFRPK